VCIDSLYCVAVYYELIAACLLRADTAAGIVIFTSLLSHAVQVVYGLRMLWAVIVLAIYWSHERHVFTLTTAAGKVTALLKNSFKTFNRHLLPSSV